MPRGKPIGIEMRSRIVTLHEEGYSIRQISGRVGIPKSTVKDTIHNFEQRASLKYLNRPGPSRSTSHAEDQHIKLISKRNRKLTAPEIAAEFNRGRDKALSVSTVKRRLQEAGLHGRVAVRKPLLRRGNRQKRLEWARTHRQWTMENWKNVLWTDESKFEIFGQKRRIFVRRSKDEKFMRDCVLPTVKHGGGSVQIWGCFSYAGTGDLVKIVGIMKKEQYRNILEQHAVPSGIRLIGKNFIFMNDNDPKHTSRLCKTYLEDLQKKNILTLMSWPPQSPDLNPIELLWDELDRRVRKEAPTSQQHLWEILQREWNNFEHETLTKLIERMPRIVCAVLNAKGGYFDEKKV